MPASRILRRRSRLLPSGRTWSSMMTSKAFFRMSSTAEAMSAASVVWGFSLVPLSARRTVMRSTGSSSTTRMLSCRAGLISSRVRGSAAAGLPPAVFFPSLSDGFAMIPRPSQNTTEINPARTLPMTKIDAGECQSQFFSVRKTVERPKSEGKCSIQETACAVRYRKTLPGRLVERV